MNELRQQFRPEFLNRLDDVVLFSPLTSEEIGKIVDLLLRDLQGRIAEHGIAIELTPEARELIVREGYDPVYGARPLKRFIQNEVETPLARMMLRGELADKSRVLVKADGDQLRFEAAEAVPSFETVDASR
jgi:ATP-dependent Clp protease ATP-binding subunit ClpB